MQNLQSWPDSQDIVKLVNVIRKDKERVAEGHTSIFKMEVFEPPCLSVDVADSKIAGLVEACISGTQMRVSRRVSPFFFQVELEEVLTLLSSLLLVSFRPSSFSARRTTRPSDPSPTLPTTLSRFSSTSFTTPRSTSLIELKQDQSTVIRFVLSSFLLPPETNKLVS